MFSVAETQASANLHALYLICRFERHRSCGGSLDFEGGVVGERWVQDTAVGENSEELGAPGNHHIIMQTPLLRTITEFCRGEAPVPNAIGE